MKAIALCLVIATGLILGYATLEMPVLADPYSPASTHVSPRYIEKADEETYTPNLVTAILGDYRSLDTMGEVFVVFAAAVGCMLMLRKRQYR